MPKLEWSHVLRALRLALVLGAVLIARLTAWSDGPVQALTDHISYDVGEEVHLRILSVKGSSPPPGTSIMATLRYAGESQAIPLGRERLQWSVLSPKEAGQYEKLWQIPLEARTGRYMIDLTGRDSASHQVFTLPHAASFTVHRKLARIEKIQLGRTFYTSGDPVNCDVVVKNMTNQPLKGLRVEFSDRYWPWIAAPAERAAKSVVPLATALDLPGGETRGLHSERVAAAPVVKQPSVHQFGIVVWDQARKEVLDIAFSQLTFIYPPGVDTPRPYPGQYPYSNLNAIKAGTYRHFYPPESSSTAIEFDRTHTMFASGDVGIVKFSVFNRTPKPWRTFSIHTSVLGCAVLACTGPEVSNQVVSPSAGLEPGAPPLTQEVEFRFPAEGPGLYRAGVQVRDASGRILAASTEDLAVNPLPKSLLIFCAHEDDEGAYSGLARAAVENHIPLHYVYFTSGDAGSCDRYYEHSCGPEEAFSFGALRMDETRASLGHLGVPREDIYYLGLPDGGSGQIWYDHTHPSRPFLDPLLATDRAPYEGLVHPNLPYARDSVVEAVEELIKRFQPDVLCTAHPQQVGHIDHIVNNYFVVKALQTLLREKAVSPHLTLLVDAADPKKQPPTPYHYQPFVFYASGEVMALAQEASWFYLSQNGSQAAVGMRSFDKLPRTERLRRLLDWQEHEGWNETR